MKKKLLIAYRSPYLFHAAITPLIADLSETFDIFILTTNYYLKDDFTEQLEHWREDGTIIDYLIVPMFISNSTENQNILNILKVHFFMRTKLNYLRNQKFDLLLIGSTDEIYERYLIDCILPHECVCVGLLACGFPLANYPVIIEGIFRGESASDLIMSIATPGNYKQNETSKVVTIKDNPIRRVASKFIRSSSKSQFIKKGILFALNRFSRYPRYIMNRYIIPAILVHKTFPPRRYEHLTYFDTNELDSFIVFQKIQALFFRSFCKNNVRVYLSQYPFAGSCRCSLTQQKPDKVLVCLSGYEGTINQQKLLYRDLQIVMSESGAKEAHIRPHPKKCGSEVEKLQIYLKEKGIAVTIMGVDKLIRDIACDYIGIVGCASASLLEARNACDYTFVVGFVGISEAFAENPKYLLGDIGNLEKRIDWIEADGSYNPDIFKRKYHPAPPYRTIPEILNEISKKSK